MSIVEERTKNEYLHYLLSTLRSPELKYSTKNAKSLNTDQFQLERTYRKALVDYNLACEQLESHAVSASKEATKLRARLNEKEDKASKLSMTLHKYREDIAKQSSFSNAKPLGMEFFEELESQDLGEELECERLRQITNQVNVSQLEQKLRHKNELAGGVSDVEFNNLEDGIHKTEAKITFYDNELKNMDKNADRLLKMESFLTTAIQQYENKQQTKEKELKDLDKDIEEKRSSITFLNRKSRDLQKEVGYDANDLGAYLSTRLVNDDYSSSADERDKLHAKLNGLVMQHSALVKDH